MKEIVKVVLECLSVLVMFFRRRKRKGTTPKAGEDAEG